MDQEKIKKLEKGEITRGFAVTGHKGVRFTFANGWGISVQWGPCNYGSNYDVTDFDAPRARDIWASGLAEIAVIDPHGDPVPPPHPSWTSDDSVLGYQTPDQVMMWMAFVAAYPKEKKS